MKKIIFSVFILFSLSFFFFTDIYINKYDFFFRYILEKNSYIDSLNFKKVSGNLISGLELEDINISSHSFRFESKMAILKLKKFFLLDYFQSDVGKITYLKIKKNTNENLSSTEKNNDYLIINFNELLITQSKQFYNFNFKVNNLKKFGITLSDANINGSFNGSNYINAEIKISELELLHRFFPNINLTMNYDNETFYFNVPKNINSTSQFLRANFEISSPKVKINSAAIRFKDEDSLFVNNEQLFFSNVLSGENLKINYINGSVNINKFKFQDTQTYFFDLKFDDFNLKLFKGLKAEGRLSGDLYISNNKSAIFKNTKIKNFSFEKIRLDEIYAEGYIADDFYNISDINVTKKIGFIDVSTFYNKIIEEFNLKY
tara:strand:+ start:488 stop:1612 length:1125 start_codon:yes stop_codon:yes gene_type:complete